MSFPRYSTYKDSGIDWLGEVPGHWETTQMRYLLQAGTHGMKIGPFGSQLTKDMLSLTGFKVYGQENVINDDFSLGDRFVDAAKFDELAVYETRGGDVLVTMMGTSGRCAVVPDAVSRGVIDSHLLRIRLRSGIDSGFIRTLIDQARYVEAQIKVLGKGSIMHGLNSSIVRELKIVLPPADEQLLIQTFLDREAAKIDALVVEQQRLIELLKEKRQAAISHAVTKGLNPDAPKKDSGIEWMGEVPAHWDVVPTKRLVSASTSGPRGWSDLAGSEGSIFFQSQNIGRSMDVVLDEAKRVQPPEDAESERARLRLDDVVVCITGARTGSVAHVSNLEERSYVNQHVCLLRPLQEKISGRFLSYALFSRSGQEQLAAAMYGLKQGLGLDQLRTVAVALPPAREQTAIIDFIDGEAAKIAELITEAESAIALLLERRSALISAAVTGQIDVRGLAQAEAA